MAGVSIDGGARARMIERVKSLDYDPVESSRKRWYDCGWHEAASGVAAVVAVMRADQIFQAQANEVLRELDITFARYQVLGVVAGEGPLLLGEIGRRLWITKGTVTAAIDRLEQDALILRVPDSSDGRATYAVCTPKGQRVFDRAVDELNTKLFGAIGLSVPEMDQLVQLIGKIRTASGDTVGVLPPDLA
jgi:DNA-binding MarR family transcriptional regulator